MRPTITVRSIDELKKYAQEVGEYEKTGDSLALLQILEQSRKCLKEGKHKPLNRAIEDLEKKAGTGTSHRRA